MCLKKSVLSLFMGLFSVSIMTGCQGNDSGPTISQELQMNAYRSLELSVEPITTFDFDGGKGSVLAIEGPAANRDFVFLGKRIIYAHGAVFRHGDEYRPPRIGHEEKGPTQELYKMPIENGKIKARYGIEYSSGTGEHAHNLTACKGYVLFERAKNGTLGLYDGKKVYGTEKWKDEFNGMVGTAEGELLLVRQPDTLCIAKLEGMGVSEPEEILADASDCLGRPKTVLHPVHLDKDELFASIAAKGQEDEDLGCFSRDGRLIMLYDGAEIETSDWAVTDNYVLQAGRKGLAIYERHTGVKVFLGEIQDDVHAVLLDALEGDRVLFHGICQRDTFGIIQLNPVYEPGHMAR